MPVSPDLMLWLEVKTTNDGGDVLSDAVRVLEVGYSLTTPVLKELIHTSYSVLNRNVDHTDILRMLVDPDLDALYEGNGMWAEVEDFGTPLSNVERTVISDLREAIKAEQIRTPSIQMMGSAATRLLVKNRMPDLDRYLLPGFFDVAQLSFFASTYLINRLDDAGVDEEFELVGRAEQDVLLSVSRLRALLSALA